MPPARLAFLNERLHAFKRRLVHHVAGHGLNSDFVGGCDAQFDLTVEKLLPHRYGDSRFGDNAGNESFDFGVKLFWFGNTVD